MLDDGDVVVSAHADEDESKQQRRHEELEHQHS